MAAISSGGQRQCLDLLESFEYLVYDLFGGLDPLEV